MTIEPMFAHVLWVVGFSHQAHAGCGAVEVLQTLHRPFTCTEHGLCPFCIDGMIRGGVTRRSSRRRGVDHPVTSMDGAPQQQATAHSGDNDDDYHSPVSRHAATCLALACVAITAVAVSDLAVLGRAVHVSTAVNCRRVLWYGWITAVSTGLGVVPFFFLGRLPKWWVAACNGEFAAMQVCGFVPLSRGGVLH